MADRKRTRTAKKHVAKLDWVDMRQAISDRLEDLSVECIEDMYAAMNRRLEQESEYEKAGGR